MEESNEEASLDQIYPQPFDSSLISHSSPPQKQTLNSDSEEQKDEIKTEEKEAGIKEDITVPSIQPPIAKPTNEIPLSRSTIKKIQSLYQNFNPKQILSSKKQSFLAHEDVFRSLNLWEFLNLDFESEVRSDLIVELICTYDELECYGFVRGFKIGVGKFDIAHALKVPVEKNETHESIYRKDENKDVILRFLSGFVLLDDEEEDDDMCILPEEAIQAIKLVKNGAANEVDWCGLIWGLVVKDIIDAYTSGYSKSASYLHCLIKAQCPNLLLDDVYVPKLEPHLDVSDSMDTVESSSSEEDEEEFGNDEDESEDDLGTELSLGNNGNVDLMNDINWNGEGSNEEFEFDLRRCNSNNETNMEFENFCEEKNDYSNDVLHSYTPQMNLVDQNLGPSSSNFYDGNIVKSKRHLDADDTADHCHQNNNRQKRVRINTGWGEEEVEIPRSEFDSYNEQLQSTIRKAEMLYVEKEQACIRAHFQLQCLNELLMQKDEVIKDLQKTHEEEQQSWEFTVDRYKHELNVLANLAFSYKSALKETQKKFDEYKKTCPGVDEFLYHDVAGPGGLVLTLKEIEKMKFEKEEEMKLIAEEMVLAFESEWLVKFDEYNELVLLNGMKLAELEESVKCFKERMAECKGKSS